MFTFKQTEFKGRRIFPDSTDPDLIKDVYDYDLFTVGIYDANNNWIPHSDHPSIEEAVREIKKLNKETHGN